jgi:hypothetical protein
MTTTTTTKLDEISAAIEQTVKTLRGGAAPTRKRMKLDEFVTFALTEIQKAAKDEPAVAKRRLVALKRSVDDVITAIAKMSAEDTESEDIEIEVTTAFAPTKADGDKPMNDVTTTTEQSSTEVALTAVTPASGDSAFAENLGQVAKAIQKLKEDLGTTSADNKPRARAEKRNAGDGDGGHGSERDDDREGREGREGDPDGWPLDLATEEFLKGDASTENDPLWGYDPAGVASAKER